jgi:NAD(P)-dependent dehydrogenase (short-subunit alcohol dehydrogenase family)
VITGPETTRTALVTGVARGIGKAIALRLLDDGWGVVGTVRGPAGDLVEQAAGRPLELIEADLADDADVARLIATLRPMGLKALVHNAGVLHVEDPAAFSLADWRDTMQVNLTAPVQITRELAPHLAPGASVVAIASTDGLRGSYDTIAYGVSKAALINAVAGLGNLLGPAGIRVNAVSPGWIETDMGAKEVAAARDITPLGRVGAPAEVAAAVAWLISDDAAFVTGANVVVDGGYIQADNVLKLEAG